MPHPASMPLSSAWLARDGGGGGGDDEWLASRYRQCAAHQWRHGPSGALALARDGAVRPFGMAAIQGCYPTLALRVALVLPLGVYCWSRVKVVKGLPREHKILPAYTPPSQLPLCPPVITTVLRRLLLSALHWPSHHHHNRVPAATAAVLSSASAISLKSGTSITC